MTTQTFTVTGMTCGHCRATVEKALSGVRGVYGATVDLEQGRAEVDCEPAVTAETLIRAVEAAGYGAEVAA